MSHSLITLKLVIFEVKKAAHDLRASFPAAVTPVCSSISISRMSPWTVSSSDFWFHLHQQCLYFFRGHISYVGAGPGSTEDRANDAVSRWACRSSRKETHQNATNYQE